MPRGTRYRTASSQQPSPQAHPSLHCTCVKAAGQATLQLTTDTQWTRHVPWQVTSQFFAEVHVTVLASPTLGAQSFTLVQL
jgi:hypothetical protein